MNKAFLVALTLVPGCLLAQAQQATSTASPSFFAVAATTPHKAFYGVSSTGDPVKTQFRLAKKPTRPVVEESAFRIGVRGGASYVLPLEGFDGATYKFSVGYLGGIVFNVGRGLISFQPEVNYSQVSVKVGATYQSIDISGQAIENRIEVPLLVKASFGDPDRTRFFVNAGPYGTYGLSGRLKASAGSSTIIDEKITYDGTEGRISYGVAGGLGVAIKLGPGSLTVEGRALYKLGDNTNASPLGSNTGTPVPTGAEDTKYMVLQGSLGYLIPIGGR